jgi:aminopeptidase N
MRYPALALAVLFLAAPLHAQFPGGADLHADSLRGQNGPARAWWDVAFYDLRVKVSPSDSTISGVSHISYRIIGPAKEMQVDLQEPLVIDSVVQKGKKFTFRRDGNAWFVAVQPQPKSGMNRISVYYHGKPRVAKNPPWDGGFAWGADSLGNRWIATACQGLGASVWWPTKDIQSDEPDSQAVSITVPGDMQNVSNGRLRGVTKNPDGTATWNWFVAEPINNYNIAVNAGHYAHIEDSYQGEAGKLTLDYWPLAYHKDVATKQFAQVKPMMACFEKWFGPYPWYKDGYKLIETGHLGMEHQSGIAYGNHYQNGYRGRDLSGSGQGLDWDFIIVHESAHEWWGNSLTSADLADMWIHEGFGNYAEGIYVECLRGKEAGAAYNIGNRRGIRNDKPIVPEFGLNHEGSGDMYPKGGNMLHTIRQVVNDDEKWRGILRGLQKTFRHQIVTGKQVQDYISKQGGYDFSTVFQQYLTTTQIPELEYKIDGTAVSYRWTNVVPGFKLPIRVGLPATGWSLVTPTESWQTAKLAAASDSLRVDPNFYITSKKVQ